MWLDEKKVFEWDDVLRHVLLALRIPLMLCEGCNHISIVLYISVLSFACGLAKTTRKVGLTSDPTDDLTLI